MMGQLKDRARELARGLREQIIFEGNEDSPGKGENKDMTVDTSEEESEVLEEVGDVTEQVAFYLTNKIGIHIYMYIYICKASFLDSL